MEHIHSISEIIMSNGNKSIPGKKNTRRELSVPGWKYQGGFDKSVRDRNLAVEHRGESNRV